MSIDNKLARPQSLTAIAKESIRQAIILGELPFGAQLSETALAVRFGVSKTPVREALLQLKLEGLVDIQPQRGTFVFEPDAVQVGEICRFREIIETAALDLAIREHAGELVRQLKRALEQGSQPHGKHLVDALFHGAIVECSGSAYLHASYQLVADKIQALRSRLPDEHQAVDACQDTHARIAELVEQGDAAQGCAVLRDHIRSTEQSYVRALSAA